MRSKNPGTFVHGDGYHIKQTHSGWVFLEGIRETKSFFLTRTDMNLVDACARKRGINTYTKYVTRYTELGGLLFN